MVDIQHLRDRAARCIELADNLLADAETLRRFGEDLAELARISEELKLGTDPREARGLGPTTQLSS